MLEGKIREYASTLTRNPHIRFTEGSVAGNITIAATSLASLVAGAPVGYNLYEEHPYMGALIGAAMGCVAGMGIAFLVFKGVDYANDKIDEYKIRIHEEKRNSLIAEYYAKRAFNPETSKILLYL